MALYFDLAQDSYWKNRAGMGTTADRSRVTRFVSEFASENDLADWYSQDGLFATAIGMMIDDALRQGVVVSSKDASKAEGSEGSNAVQDLCNTWWNDEGVVELLTQYFTQKRLFGGSIMLQIADVDQSIPRSDNAAPDPGTRFMAFAPSEMTAITSVIQDPVDPMYGYPVRWNLVSKNYDITWTRPIRTPRLFSTNLHLRQSGSQWAGPSDAYKFMTQIQYWGLTVQAAVSALQTLSQRILKTPRLKQVQTGNETAVANFIEQRLQDINDRASNQQAVVVDDTEDLVIAQSSISGMEAVMDRLMVAVSACARVPVVRLFGVSPGGFGTGESELRNYYDSVRVFQCREVAPAIKWMLERKFPGAANWTIEFPPLGAPTEAELIDMRNKQAQTDATYVGTGVLSADEVANSRFGGTTYSYETTLDLDARHEAEEALDLELPDEDQPDDDPASTDEPPSAPTSPDDETT